MEELSKRSAQEVLDDHLNLAENWGGEEGFESINRALSPLVPAPRSTCAEMVVPLSGSTSPPLGFRRIYLLRGPGAQD